MSHSVELSIYGFVSENMPFGLLLMFKNKLIWR